MAKVPYNPATDFVPISAVSTNRFALLVNAKVPVKTVSEFVEYAKPRPKASPMRRAARAASPICPWCCFLNRVGLKGINVSYKGTQPALTDVVAGHLPAMFALFGDALSQAQNGAIRLLAVSSEQRSVQAPDVPTVAESGLPRIQDYVLVGLDGAGRNAEGGGGSDRGGSRQGNQG